MKAFFDTNILISLFRLSNEDIESLQKLVSASKRHNFQLVTTPLLRNEYERFREKAISDGIAAFSSNTIGANFPPFVRSYAAYARVSEDLKKLKADLRVLASEVRDHAERKQLLVDDVIEEFFASSHEIQETPEILRRARKRVEKGNPPRKKADSIGDSLHWESLLADAKPFETLVIVSRDGDFESELSKGKPKDFLQREWSQATQGEGELHIVSSLHQFVTSYAPDVEIGSEFSAEFLVEELFKSDSYRRTHEIIDLLRGASGLNVGLVSKIIQSIHENQQVGNIVGDADVQEFLADLYEGFSSSDVGAELLELLGGGWV